MWCEQHASPRPSEAKQFRLVGLKRAASCRVVFQAALGGKLAAELAGLNLLEEAIQDRATNTTRFLVIGEKTCPPTGKDRTSLLFAIHDRPGSLVKALQAFEHFDINMSKIESRPSKRKDWEYVFYVDLAGHCEDAKVSEAMTELERHCSIVKLLGSYADTSE